MNKVDIIKRIWHRFKNSDPIYNCPVYKNEGCAHVNGPLCVPSECNIVHKYLDNKWTGCATCEFNYECCCKYKKN